MNVRPRTMASTSTGRERSLPPIASRRARRCSAQAGHTSTLCSAVSSRCPHSDDTPAFRPPNPPLLKEGLYRRDCDVPSTGCDSRSFHTVLKPSWSSVRHAAICRGSGVSPRVSPSTRTWWPALPYLLVSRWQSGKEARRLTGDCVHLGSSEWP